EQILRLVRRLDAQLEEVLAAARRPSKARAQPVVRIERVDLRLRETRATRLRPARAAEEIRGVVRRARASVAADDDGIAEVGVRAREGVGRGVDGDVGRRVRA